MTVLLVDRRILGIATVDAIELGPQAPHLEGRAHVVEACLHEL